MKKHQVILSAVLLVLFLGVQTPQFAQDASTGPAKADQERRIVAIGLLRTINTAEATYHARNGSFVVWKTLVSDQPKYFAHFSDAPEILPGWNLRFNVHLDGQGYDLLLR